MTSVPALCGISAGLLHYFMLVFFSWTAVESVFLFMKLVKVVGGGIPKYTLKAGIIAWSKCLIVNILLYMNVVAICKLHHLNCIHIVVVIFGSFGCFVDAHDIYMTVVPF